jgi:hypothetical protein
MKYAFLQFFYKRTVFKSTIQSCLGSPLGLILRWLFRTLLISCLKITSSIKPIIFSYNWSAWYRPISCVLEVVPLRHAGVKGGRRCSSFTFLTSALDGGEWSASLPGRALPPGKGSPVPIGLEAGWASELVWTQGLEEKSFASARDRTPVDQSVVRHLPYYAVLKFLQTLLAFFQSCSIHN